MQRRYIRSKGKTYLVNVVGYEDGIGAGFAVGQLVLKSISDNHWYVITTSGSIPSVTTYISQSALSFPTSSYFDLNYPYQLLACADGNTYAVYLSGSAPNAALVISQSMYTSGSSNAKPYLFLQNITDCNYYGAYLTASAGQISMSVSQTMTSQSWVRPIF
jgi:hypothetical protein